MPLSNAHLRPLSGPASRSLADEIYDALVDMLTAGLLEPHTPLSIDGVSQQLQVSPTPVREALARLEATGLVERQARRGYRVASPMSQRNMRELVDARIVLEAGALERAMENPAPLVESLEEALAAHAEISERLAASDGPLEPADAREYFDRDWMFHQAILDHCENRYIERSVNNLSFGVHRMRQTLGMGRTDASEAVAEHRKILDAVRTGNTEAALAALNEHLSNVRDRSGDNNQVATA